MMTARKTLAGLLALVVVAVTLSLSSTAAAQTVTYPNRDNPSAGVAWTEATCTATTGKPFGDAGTWTATGAKCDFIGDGAFQASTEVGVDDVWAQIQDRAIEWTPVIIVIFAGILIFGFTLLLLAVGSRKALSKLMMLVRRA